MGEMKRMILFMITFQDVLLKENNNLRLVRASPVCAGVKLPFIASKVNIKPSPSLTKPRC